MIIEYPPELNFTNINPLTLYYEFYLCHEKIIDNKEFSCGDLKPVMNHESRSVRSNPVFHVFL